MKQQFHIQTLPEVTTGLWFWPSNIVMGEGTTTFPKNFSSNKEKLKSACLQWISELHPEQTLIIKFVNNDGFCVKWVDETNTVRWWCFEYEDYHLEGQVLIRTKEVTTAKLK